MAVARNDEKNQSVMNRIRMRFLALPDRVKCVCAACAIVAMGALLVWFLIFSGMTEPVQFIYEGF